jgi:transcriptional regulator with XRE-family HTH domain
MTSSARERVIPTLTLGWRLQMALRHGGVTRDAMADYLGVSPSTISRWNGDKGEAPKRAYLAMWAMYTGVDRDWLETGEGSPAGPTSPVPPNEGPKKPSTDALDKLTKSKLSRSRRAATDTQRYLPAA